jgi:F-type H+-transporting ATPase subunit b
MKKYLNSKFFIAFFGFLLLFATVIASSALGAEEQTPGWRSTYDTVMLWVNFGILAFVIVKFGRKPLINFLYGQKESLEKEINRLENSKKEVGDKIEEMLKTLDESESRFEEMKQKIIERGEKRRSEIIEDAKRQSRTLLESTKRKAENRIRQARDKLKSDMVDRAIEIALEKLPAEITAEDNQKMVGQFLDTITATK